MRGQNDASDVCSCRAEPGKSLGRILGEEASPNVRAETGGVCVCVQVADTSACVYVYRPGDAASRVHGSVMHSPPGGCRLRCVSFCS